MNLERLIKRFMKYASVHIALFRDPRTPMVSKVLLGLAVVYVIWPVDILPDFIPFVGILDEIILIPLLFFIATSFIPKNVRDEYKKGKKKKKRSKKNSK